jgi:hypothetical protein
MRLIRGNKRFEFTQAADCESKTKPRACSDHSLDEEAEYNEEEYGEYDGRCEGRNILPEVITSPILFEDCHDMMISSGWRTTYELVVTRYSVMMTGPL